MADEIIFPCVSENISDETGGLEMRNESNSIFRKDMIRNTGVSEKVFSTYSERGYAKGTIPKVCRFVRSKF